MLIQGTFFGTIKLFHCFVRSERGIQLCISPAECWSALGVSLGFFFVDLGLGASMSGKQGQRCCLTHAQSPWCRPPLCPVPGWLPGNGRPNSSQLCTPCSWSCNNHISPPSPVTQDPHPHLPNGLGLVGCRRLCRPVHRYLPLPPRRGLPGLGRAVQNGAHLANAVGPPQSKGGPPDSLLPRPSSPLSRRGWGK